MFYECDTILWTLNFSFLALNRCQMVLDGNFCLCFPLQRPSLVTVVEWIDYETLALLFGMVRLLISQRCFSFTQQSSLGTV